MKIVVFGATGMVGQGVIRECLLAPDVEQVLAIGRNGTGKQDSKLREILHENALDYTAVEGDLAGLDACFYCLGVSSAGMSEQDYSRVTHDMTIAAARSLLKMSPQLTFVFVSGAGTDSTGKGRTMWARVKGKTENAILAMPFKNKCAFRPAFIQPLHGIKSKTRAYRTLYSVIRPAVPLLKLLFPKDMTTTEKVGRAMLEVARKGPPKPILENEDINSLA